MWPPPRARRARARRGAAPARSAASVVCSMPCYASAVAPLLPLLLLASASSDAAVSAASVAGDRSSTDVGSALRTQAMCTSISASSTDRRIKNFGRSVHYYCNPGEGVTARQQLFIMIPGIQPEICEGLHAVYALLSSPHSASSDTARHHLFADHWPVETGASAGYHSIGVSWFDKPAAGGVCYESAWARRTNQTDGRNATQVRAGQAGRGVHYCVLSQC
eukprot:SAG25_NODE_1162_length_3720_cov_739.361502_1_plen_220_part_00